MFARPWICRTCSSRLLRPFVRQQGRLQSTTVKAPDSLPSTLLARARAIADEHNQLTQKLSNGFDSKAAKKLGELSPVVNALREWNKANESLSELQSLMRDPTTDPELLSLATEDLEATRDSLTNAAQGLTTSLVPVHPFSHMPCLIEIRPGPGGLEASIFAGDLLRMYQNYCSRHNLRTTILKLESMEGIADAGTLSEAVLEVEAENAYGIFRCEAGVHRVQRVPVTEKQGRVHTSTASVLVLPNVQESTLGEEDIENPESDYYIDPQDVRTEIMRARGAGGQHVNTTDSAVRLTHIPTNTVVSIQDARSQHKNKAKAWQLLRSRIAQARREKREEEIVAMRRSVIGVAKTGRSDKVRTYNWNQQRVTDHRSGTTVHDLDGVIQGGQTLDEVMESVRGWLMERDLEALIAGEESKNKEKQKKN
ncbi:release factor [Delitschia confertaspora ATCC 74209]|uniref:Release factor n=1 Tax=Delitschia confertaspora ATCC 74209 TaxID=1513339 RepID=A0A9P4JUU1_9PLEO|nr:release factor [Delitschia confertaspora ATCC 74209]